MGCHCYCSVAQSCPTLCNPKHCSTPGFPNLHCLPEFAPTHVYWVDDAIQPSHLLSPPSPALSLSQHQGLFPMSQLFASGGQSIGASALVLLMNIQGWFPLGLTGLISLLSKGLLRVFSNTTVWKHQSFSTQPSLWLPLTQTIMWMVPPGLKAYNSLVSNFSIFLGRSLNLTPRNSWEKYTSA